MTRSKIERLLEIGSTSLGDAATETELPPGCAALDGLLHQKNGLFAFESALHVMGRLHQPEALCDVLSWNESSLWRAHYSTIPESVFFFAQDAFGGQFGVDVDGSIVTFEPETGELTPSAADLEEWAGLMLDDWKFMTGYSCAKAWQHENGALPLGHRLYPKRPFVAGGEYEVANLFACEAAQAMRNYANIADQIRDLPAGANVRLVVTD